MNPTPTAHHDSAGNQSTTSTKRRNVWTSLALAVGAAVLAACGGATTSSTTTTPPATNAPADSSPAAPALSDGNVLPVASNPINNAATEVLFAIDEVLVENNVDPTTGKAADDHLEIAVTNTGTAELTGIEVYYTITDPTGDIESYYTKLPDSFTVAAGASRTIHFDNSGAPDHFPDNPYSLYHTSLNGLDVTVEVSAQGAAPQTATVQKDPGGDEVAD